MREHDDPLISAPGREYRGRGGTARGGDEVGARTSGILRIGLVGATLAACSSSGRAAVTTTASVAVTSAPLATTATTAVPPTVATTTVAPTTTTIDPKAKAEADVRAAIKLAEDTFSACLVAMPKCDPQTLAVARSGPLLERNIARISDWNAQGLTVREREKFRYVIESVTLAEASLERATAVVCIADGSIRVRPGAGPDGSDVVVDEQFVSGRDALQLRLESDGVWRIFDGPALGPEEHRDVCG